MWDGQALIKLHAAPVEGASIRRWLPLPPSICAKVFGLAGFQSVPVCACVCTEFACAVATEPIEYASHLFPYDEAAESPFLNKGVLHWIGTSGRTTEYVNPHSSQQVTVSRSSEGTSDGIQLFVHHSTHTCVNTTSSSENNYMAVDLSSNASRHVIPHYYCLRHGFSGSYTLVNWELQGSIDGLEWDTLRRHEDDTSLGRNFGEAAWAVEAAGARYSHFRILQFGANKEGSGTLCCSGFELFGELFEDPSSESLRATPKVCI